jgi:hypothetical protein
MAAFNTYPSRLIKIVDLLLDRQNYRLEPQIDQFQTIQAMIADQGDKLLELAEDIIEHGLSPIEFITVCPTQEDKHCVLEGNRRVTALKLLNEPALAAGTSLAKRFASLATAHAGKFPYEVECRVLPTKAEALLWIRRKHDIGMGGRAIVPWNALQIRRAQADHDGRVPVALSVLDLVSKNPDLEPAVASKLGRMPVTNLERILEDPSAMSKLGMKVEDGRLISNQSPDWTRAVLTDIVSDLATKTVKVDRIKTKDHRSTYLDDVIRRQKVIRKPSAPWDISTTPTVGAGTTSGTRGRSKSIERPRLIPKTCTLRILHPRINEIYDELRNKLKLEETPNAIAVLFRVFLELSIDEYIKKHQINCDQRSKLKLKLQAVESHMQNQGIMTKDALKPVRMASNSEDALFSTETFNAYVHNEGVKPRVTNLRHAWDELEPFMKMLCK